MKIGVKYLFSLLLLTACSGSGVDVLSPHDRFVAAVVDSSRELRRKDIYDGLVSLTYGASPLTEWRIEGEDTLLLVSTLQPSDWAYSDFERGDTILTSSSMDGTIWVTVPNEFKAKLLSEDVIADSLSLKARMIEILGLRPDGEESVVNMFWVDKNSLLRPSYNPDPTTNCGAVTYPENDAMPEWYKQWLEANIAYSYESPAEGLNYPFTRLGYTYDWGEGRSKYGLSEFVTIPSTALIVERRVGCWSYYNEMLSSLFKSLVVTDK